ncbi:hypothetical protein [Undibacterium danionis]|uniref:Uncharacterized protein n=1 Tax=Undibacterium danionis TaxID=1812100 RepID=A0ABV6ILY6_9BURK
MKNIIKLIGLIYLLPASLLVCNTTFAQNKSFSLGGLRLHSSTAELKANFPHSAIDTQERSTYIRIDKRDVKDSVTSANYTIQNKRATHLQLRFEYQFETPKSDAFHHNDFNTHPPCEPLLKQLTQTYGKPYGPFDGNEEGLRYKEYVWDNDTEKLIYFCARHFQDSKKNLWAAGLVIAPNKPGNCMHKSCTEP